MKIIILLSVIGYVYGSEPISGGFTEKNVAVNWVLDTADQVTFTLVCQTNGWCGMGFNENANMAGADIFLGWVTDKGKAVYYDLRAKSNSKPIIDKQQDYKVLKYGSNGTHTSFTFTRKLNTCDKEDFELTNDTVKIIFAWSDEKPVDYSSIAFHGTNVGARTVLLFNNVIKGKLPEDVFYWDILSPNYTIPSKKTTYLCSYWKAPKELRETKHHFVGYTPVVTKNAERFVHHLALLECSGNDSYYETLVGTSFDCTDLNDFLRGENCQPKIVGWGFGGEEFLMPDDVGYPISSPFGKTNYFITEFHYNNQEEVEGFVDSSGIRLYMTKKLRPITAGFTVFMANTNYSMTLPPKQPQFVVTTYVPPQCTTELFPKQGITIFSVLLHAHLTGKKMALLHFRNDAELPPIATDNSYDFLYQEQRKLNPGVKVLPGDTLIGQCTFNTMTRRKATLSGLESTDEMCFVLIMYYPATKLYFAMDGLTKPQMQPFFPNNPKNVSFEKLVADYDYSKFTKEQMKNFQVLELYGNKTGQCYGENLVVLKNYVTKFPTTTKRYEKENPCNKV